MDSEQAHCVSFLFFWFNLHFLFLKQILHLPIRRCFKEQKLNILRVVYTHKDADAHQNEEQALEGASDAQRGITQLRRASLTVGHRTPAFKFSVSFYGEFPFLHSQCRGTPALAREVQPEPHLLHKATFNSM